MHTDLAHRESVKYTIRLADEHDREIIYRMRHEVYARELGQHKENSEGRLTDQLDAINVYIVAKVGEELAGFVSITPPNEVGYSIDKYFRRDELPFRFDQELYETRILTISSSWRNTRIAALLMYAALRYIKSAGGKTVVGIGRLEVLDMYKHVGFRSLQKQVRAGSVTFELIAADAEEDRSRFGPMIADLEKHTDWDLHGVSFRNTGSAHHAGAFSEAIG